MRGPSLLLALLLAAGAAAAGDGQVVLRMRDGRLLPGKVVDLSEEGLHHAAEGGTCFYSWEMLTPYSRYEVRAAVLAEDDGPGRLALGRWCLDAGLPGDARREILRARGLGAGESKDLDGLLERCDRAQAEAAFAESDRRAAAGEWDAALAGLRSYLVAAPPSEWTEKGRERAADLVRRREADEARRRAEDAAKKKDAEARKRDDAIRAFLEGGDAERTSAGTGVLLALREEDGGSFTQFRQALERAEKDYLEARRSYERARRLAANDRPEPARLALAGRSAVDGRLLDLYLHLARKLVEFKDWKDAQAALDKALRLDPVNAEALDLQEKVKANWIRHKASELTGASGHSTPGTGGR